MIIEKGIGIAVAMILETVIGEEREINPDIAYLELPLNQNELLDDSNGIVLLIFLTFVFFCYHHTTTFVRKCRHEKANDT